MEFTPNLVIIRYLESRDIISTRVVDHSSRLYTFADFAFHDDIVPSAVNHTSSMNHDSKDTFGLLNLGVLTSDLVLVSCTSSSPSTILVDDAFVATNMASFDSV